MGMAEPIAPNAAASKSISPCSAPVALTKLLAHIGEVPEVVLLGNFLISFVPWVLQIDVHVPHEQWFAAFWALCPYLFGMFQKPEVVGWDVASHDKIAVHPCDQFKTEHIGVPYLRLLDLK